MIEFEQTGLQGIHQISEDGDFATRFQSLLGTITATVFSNLPRRRSSIVNHNVEVLFFVLADASVSAQAQ
jgi:hypothetical protein